MSFYVKLKLFTCLKIIYSTVYNFLWSFKSLNNYSRAYWFKDTNPPMWAIGSKYGPLQINGDCYLCPDCGGYGSYNDNSCNFCGGNGILSINDHRVTKNKPEGVLP